MATLTSSTMWRKQRSFVLPVNGQPEALAAYACTGLARIAEDHGSRQHNTTPKGAASS